MGNGGADSAVGQTIEIHRPAAVPVGIVGVEFEPRQRGGVCLVGDDPGGGESLSAAARTGGLDDVGTVRNSLPQGDRPGVVPASVGGQGGHRRVPHIYRDGGGGRRNAVNMDRRGARQLVGVEGKGLQRVVDDTHDILLLLAIFLVGQEDVALEVSLPGYGGGEFYAAAAVGDGDGQDLALRRIAGAQLAVSFRVISASAVLAGMRMVRAWSETAPHRPSMAE